MTRCSNRGLLSNTAFQLATRHRLGLTPSATLFSQQQCVCQSSEENQFRVDPDHLHSCIHSRQHTVTIRHDNIAHEVASLSREVGYYVVLEPNLHIRPSRNDKNGDSNDSSNDIGDEEGLHYNRHADLLLLKHGDRLYVDIAVTRPTCTSNLNKKSVQDEPGHSLKSVESRKHRKYNDICQANQYKFYAFGMESYGGLSQDAIRLLRLISAHSTELLPKQFYLYALKRLSVVLQKANANISLIGQQRLYVAQHASRKRYPSSSYPRGVGHSHPRSSIQVEKQCEAAFSVAAARVHESHSHSSYSSPLTSRIHPQPASATINHAGFDYCYDAIHHSTEFVTPCPFTDFNAAVAVADAVANIGQADSLHQSTHQLGDSSTERVIAGG